MIYIIKYYILKICYGVTICFSLMYINFLLSFIVLRILTIGGLTLFGVDALNVAIGLLDVVKFLSFVKFLTKGRFTLDDIS